MTDADRHRSQRHPDEQQLRRTVDASTALQQLLAAAAAPPSIAELRGRSRVVAEFRALNRSRSGQPLPGSRLDRLRPAWIDLHRPDFLADPHLSRLTRAVKASRTSAASKPRFACVGRWSAARLTVACAALVTVLGGTAATAVAGELPVPVQNAVAQLFSTPAQAVHPPTPPATAATGPSSRSVVGTLTRRPAADSGGRPATGGSAAHQAGEPKKSSHRHH